MVFLSLPKKPTLENYYLKTPHFIHVFVVFPLTSFFCSSIPSRIPRYIQSLCCPRILSPEVVSQTFLVFSGPWQFWGVLVGHFVGCSLICICLMFFLWLDGVYGFGRRRQQRCSALLIRHGLCAVSMTCHCRCGLDHCSEVVLARFLPWKFFFLLSIL